MECVEKLIKKDMMDPMTGDKLSDRDIIPLQRVSVGVLGSVLRWTVCLRVIRIRTVPVTSLCSVLSTVLFFCFRQGGTGFAGSGVALRAKEARPVMQV